jgi:DGQHR domain-containing protein
MGGIMEGYINFPCIEVNQPIGTFYIGAIKSDDLLRISYADIRRVEERDIERYLGIQRPLSPNRVIEIQQYVTNKDATFPTSVILAIESENAHFNSKTGIMEIKDDEKVAKIIDGQHRIAGLENYQGDVPFFVNVTIFIDMDIENQAMVFGTINLAQTKVNKSLAYDLFDLTKTRSPQKTCHNIAVFLNKEENSPFHGRIKLLGVASETNQTLTQAAIVEGILKYISGENPLAAMIDRDLLLRNKKLSRVSGGEAEKLIFRNLFIDNDDVAITRATWNYFVAVKKKWPLSWQGVNIAGNILPRTNGFRALMRFLKPVFLELNGLNQIPSVSDYQSVFDKISIMDSDFKRDKYLPGTTGESTLYKDLMKDFL